MSFVRTSVSVFSSGISFIIKLSRKFRVEKRVVSYDFNFFLHNITYSFNWMMTSTHEKKRKISGLGLIYVLIKHSHNEIIVIKRLSFDGESKRMFSIS